MSGRFEPGQVLIVGATRGIGLALTAEVLSRFPSAHVYASWRYQSGLHGLEQLKSNNEGRLSLLRCDVNRDEDIQLVVDTLASNKHQPQLVLHCAGILHEANIQPEKTVKQVKRGNLHQVFETNAFSPLIMAGKLLARIPGRGESHYAVLSAMIGSISENRLGGWYAYRASKAALNQCMKTFSIEARRTHPDLCVTLIHPGTTDTELSRPFQANIPDGRLYKPQQTATRLLDVILGGTPAESGRFMNWDGNSIPY